MRKITVVLYVVAILLSGCKKKYTHAVYEITIIATRISNNSVGNDWQNIFTYNGRTIDSGEQWTVPLSTTKTVTIDITITEIDKWPDVSSGSLTVVLKNDFETFTTITVTENKGRYKGNKAQWKIACKVKLIKKLKQK